MEADFSRIERWDDSITGETHWRTISRDNVTSLFGQTLASRVADPADPARVFSWLLDCSFDARGNVVAYDYQAEDSVGVPASVSEAGRTVTANLYLKRIRYGSTTPYCPAVDPALPAAWHFEVLLDYGDLVLMFQEMRRLGGCPHPDHRSPALLVCQRSGQRVSTPAAGASPPWQSGQRPGLTPISPARTAPLSAARSVAWIRCNVAALTGRPSAVSSRMTAANMTCTSPGVRFASGMPPGKGPGNPGYGPRRRGR